MRLKIFAFAFCLVLVLALPLSVMAETPSVSPAITDPLAETSYTWSLKGSEASGTSLSFPLTLPSGASDISFTFSCSTSNGTAGRLIFSNGDQQVGSEIEPQINLSTSFLLSSYPGATSLTWRMKRNNAADYSLSVTYVYKPSVSPAIGNPIANGSYDVSGLLNDSTDVNMYVMKDQPKTFVFSGVNAPAGTKVSYAITSEGGAVTYHDIADLADGLGINK